VPHFLAMPGGTAPPEREATASDSSDAGRPYAGRPPAARRAERRRRLLDTALELFARNGYASTPIGELCRRAGVAPAKLYEEFPTKEALLAALATELATEAVNATLEAWSGAPQDLAARAGAAVSAYLHSLLDDPRRARVLCIETTGVSDEFGRIRRDALHDFADLLTSLLGEAAADQGVSAPPIDPNSRMVGLVLVAGMQEAIVDWLHNDDPPTIECLAETLSGVLVTIGRAVLRATPNRDDTST
jgi:AcrR family transcriptional regulator